MMLCTDEQEICASRAICLTEQRRFSWSCTDSSITRWPWSSTTGKAFNTTKFVVFSSKWFKPPRDDFLFGNSLRNSRAVYRFSSQSTLNIYQRKTALCLSLSTITTQNHKLLHHHKVRVARVWWINLIIELTTVSIIHVQKIVKIKITIQVMMNKLLTCFFLWTRCIFHHFSHCPVINFYRSWLTE